FLPKGMSMAATEKKYDVLAIGNAIFDVMAPAGDATIAQLCDTYGTQKGDMQLLDFGRSTEDAHGIAERLYDDMLSDETGEVKEVSGGSAANTLAGMASLGAKTAFIGCIGRSGEAGDEADKLGKLFTHNLQAAGVDYVPVISQQEG